MRIKKALKMRDSGMQDISKAYESAEYLRLTSQETHRKIVDIIYHERMKKCPSWVRHFLDGFATAKRNEMESRCIEFCYIMPDGNKYGIVKTNADYYEKHGITPQELSEQYVTSGMFWKDSYKEYYAGPNNRSN